MLPIMLKKIVCSEIKEKWYKERRTKNKKSWKERGVWFKFLILIIPKTCFIAPFLMVCLLKYCFVYVKQYLLFLNFIYLLVHTRFLSLQNIYYHNMETSAILWIWFIFAKLPNPVILKSGHLSSSQILPVQSLM